MGKSSISEPESVRFIGMGLQMNYKDAASDMVTFLFF